MSLEKYKQKRDFHRTPEPSGKSAKVDGTRFAVQKHAARRLHFDFRLEMDGVLKSWAVPKGPSLDPQVKCLAVHVEDHPLEYADFEGVIPSGQYGSGTVMLWDHGNWHPDVDPQQGYRDGKLKFHLDGQRLKGQWALVRMSGDDGRNWLLKKVIDQWAKKGDKYLLLERHTSSVVSDRSMEQIAEDADRIWNSDTDPAVEGTEAPGVHLDLASESAARRIKKLPDSFKPQRATSAGQTPTGDEWLHEIQFAGQRCLARIGKGGLTLLDTDGDDRTDQFPSIAATVEQLGLQDTVLDGVVVVLAPDGSSDLAALQQLIQRGHDEQAVYFVFDLPYCNSFELTKVPLVIRKQWLADMLAELPRDGRLRFSDHVVGRGEVFFAQACQLSVSGVVSKRLDSRYHQRRSRNWLSVPCSRKDA